MLTRRAGQTLSCGQAAGGGRGKTGTGPAVPDLAQQGRAGDGLQRPLRSRFRQQLRRSVDMTSDVKSWVKIFDVFSRGFP